MGRLMAAGRTAAQVLGGPASRRSGFDAFPGGSCLLDLDRDESPLPATPWLQASPRSRSAKGLSMERPSRPTAWSHPTDPFLACRGTGARDCDRCGEGRPRRSTRGARDPRRRRRAVRRAATRGGSHSCATTDLGRRDTARRALSGTGSHSPRRASGIGTEAGSAAARSVRAASR